MDKLIFFLDSFQANSSCFLTGNPDTLIVARSGKLHHRGVVLFSDGGGGRSKENFKTTKIQGGGQNDIHFATPIIPLGRLPPCHPNIFIRGDCPPPHPGSTPLLRKALWSSRTAFFNRVFIKFNCIQYRGLKAKSVYL